MTSSCTSSSSSNFFQRDVSLGEETIGTRYVTIKQQQFVCESAGRSPFCFEKSYDGTHLAFGGTLHRRCHFKHVSLKQGRFYHCQTSTAHRYRIKVDDSVAIMNIKNFPIGLHVMYLYIPDAVRFGRTAQTLHIQIYVILLPTSPWLIHLEYGDSKIRRIVVTFLSK